MKLVPRIRLFQVHEGHMMKYDRVCLEALNRFKEGKGETKIDFPFLEGKPIEEDRHG